MSETNSSPARPGQPVTTVVTSNLGAADASPSPRESFADGQPLPEGTSPREASLFGTGTKDDPTAGQAAEVEELVWTGRYSMVNFLGKILFNTLLTVVAIVVAIRAGDGREYLFLRSLDFVFALFLAATWIYLFYQMVRAWFSHYYRLTTHRLFISSGVFHRRRDMIELLRVNDVKTRQDNLIDRWIGLGTVVVMSNDKASPIYFMPGVRDPKAILDLIWHHARSQRDKHSIHVDQV